MKFFKSILITALLAGLSVTAYAAPTSQDLGSKWCKDVRIHFFAGGAEGDGFAELCKLVRRTPVEILEQMQKYFTPNGSQTG